MRMLLERMRAGKSIENTKELAAKRKALLKGLAKWCLAHDVILELSDTPGRRSRNREYRIAYGGDNHDAENPDLLYDALDAEMLRLMLA
jgi:hypothetical protein